VFGELMYLLEYREEGIRLAQNDSDDDTDYEDTEKFEIPENVYIIGTMNTADRSIALVDFALRRRFAFLSLQPNWDVLRDEFSVSSVESDTLVEILEDVNDDINDQNYELGHTYFIGDGVETRSDVENVWKLEIVPYLEEYFIDQEGKVDQYRWDEVTDPAGDYDL
jgi:5-methylcytosine-specific restriction protein B